MTRNKSIEQLENDFWKEPTEFPTGLVERCFFYRKIPLEKLTIGELRTLTAQKIGLKFILELILEKLDENIYVRIFTKAIF